MLSYVKLLGQITLGSTGINDDRSTADGANNKSKEHRLNAMMSRDHHGHVPNRKGLKNNKM